MAGDKEHLRWWAVTGSSFVMVSLSPVLTVTTQHYSHLPANTSFGCTTKNIWKCWYISIDCSDHKIFECCQLTLLILFRCAYSLTNISNFWHPGTQGFYCAALLKLKLGGRIFAGWRKEDIAHFLIRILAEDLCCCCETILYYSNNFKWIKSFVY